MCRACIRTNPIEKKKIDPLLSSVVVAAALIFSSFILVSHRSSLMPGSFFLFVSGRSVYTRIHLAVNFDLEPIAVVIIAIISQRQAPFRPSHPSAFPKILLHHRPRSSPPSIDIATSVPASIAIFITNSIYFQHHGHHRDHGHDQIHQPP